MDLPTALPYRLYLLALDPRRGRTTARMELGYVLQAAALAELQIGGYVDDSDGRVTVQRVTGVDDPYLDGLLQQIHSSKPRRWQHWVSRGARKAARQVRDALAAANVVRLEQHRALGVFPATRVSLTDPRMLDRLAQRVEAALDESRPVARIDPRDAAMVALAATGELRTAMPRARRRRHRQRLTELSEVAEPVVKALRKAIRTARSQAASV